MSSFRSQDSQMPLPGINLLQYLKDRFPDSAIGYPEWVDFIENLRKTGQEFKPPRRILTLKRPRVFVSHKQQDERLALRVAWIANQKGFDYWLDVLDPYLQSTTANLVLNDREKSLITAAIIEMGLLNCSHVIAVITKIVKKSRWVPYEYGRAKDRGMVSEQAAAWISNQVAEYPEYLLLGHQHRTENDIQIWFEDQLKAWRSRHSHPTTPPTAWPPPMPSDNLDVN